MAPPAALRRRLEQQRSAAAAKDGTQKPMRSPSRAWAMCIAVVVATLAGVCWLLAQLFWRSEAAEALEEIRNPEVLKLLDDATQAIRQKYNYTLALNYIERALSLEPRSSGVKKFYASVLMSLDRDQDASIHLRDVFQSQTASARDPHFLQQYVLALHRLEKQEELAAIWPRIQATPGVLWRSPLQCPDKVDEAFLDGAVPFPSPDSLRVTRLMRENIKAIANEFDDFRRQPGWSSEWYFKPNQDNDLVLGNGRHKWTEMLLFDKGAWDPRFCAILPTACKILAGLREVEGVFNGKRSGQVSLLKLEAGATLVPHFGSVNWRYTAHLGLLVPENVTMYAGNEFRRFVQGEVLLIDDSFLHSVRNEARGPRVTFFVNFFHPKAKPLSVEEWYAQGSQS